jgi:hypothetical protein
VSACAKGCLSARWRGRCVRARLSPGVDFIKCLPRQYLPCFENSRYYILPPLRLHFDLNFLRSLPCRFLALARSEQALEMACLLVAPAAA